MERVHYRRHMPSKLHNRHIPERPPARHVVHTENPPEERANITEKIIVQGIISAIILSVVLVLSIVDNPRVEGIRENLGHALSANVTTEQVAAEISRFFEIPVDIGPVYVETPAERPAEIMAPRIDEDMLRELFGQDDGESLQPTAPGPIMSPEL